MPKLLTINPQSSGLPLEGGTLSGNTTLQDDKQLVFGTGSDAALEYDTANTPDTLKLGVSSDSNTLVVCEKADMQTDFALPAQTDPTIDIQSADATKPYQALLLTHNEVRGRDPTTDVDPPDLLIKAPNSAPAGTGTNQTGSTLTLAAGIGTRFITIVDNDAIDDSVDTVTVSVNGTALTAQTAVAGAAGANQWSTDTSTTATATSLAAALNALAGISATSSGAVVSVVADPTTWQLSIATTMGAEEGAITAGANGDVYIRSGPVLGSYILLAGTGINTFVGPSGSSWTFSNHVAMSSTVAITGALSANGTLVNTTKFSHTTSAISIANTDTTFAITRSLHTISQTSGTSTITTITGGVSGMQLVLCSTTTGITLTDTAVAGATVGQLCLNGNFTSGVCSTITLVYLPVGAAAALVWVEQSRSANG